MNDTYQREYDASPSYQWYNAGQLASGSVISMSWETYNTVTKKYLPFNLTRIVNNGESDIWFYPNQNMNNGIYVPKGTILTMDFNFLPALSYFAIKNAQTTTITVGKIIVTCSKQGQSADSIVSRLHKRLFDRNKSGVV